MYPPVFYLYEPKRKQQQNQFKYLIRGDFTGKISTWTVKNNLTNATTFSNETPPDYGTSLENYWRDNFRMEEQNFGEISTFLYLPLIDKIVYGTHDGSIIILPAVNFLLKYFFGKTRSKDYKDYLKLKKHNSKVTCILYPHGEHTRYDPSMLVTGSSDFSVILWNINTGEMTHRFVVQTGEVLQLSVPPNNVNPRILQCICSITSDNSVALLSLRECKPVMVASRHIYPVMFIKWRPLDDYLIVKCLDGGVFVWQIETGNLDRVAHGMIGEDIISAADEFVGNNQIVHNENAQQQQLTTTPQPPIRRSSSTSPRSAKVSPFVNKLTTTNQAIELSQILHRRNTNFKLKSFHYKQSIGNSSTKSDNQKVPPTESNLLNFPLIMQTFHLSDKDPLNHLLLFDIDSLLNTLVGEEQSLDAMIKTMKANMFKETHNVQTAPTSVIAPLYRTTTDHSLASSSGFRRNVSAKQFDAFDLKQLNMLKVKTKYIRSIIKLTQILLSSLHVWSIDSDLDKMFIEKLSFQKPKVPMYFGRVSRGAHLFVMFPSKLNPLNKVTPPPPAPLPIKVASSDVTPPVRPPKPPPPSTTAQKPGFSLFDDTSSQASNKIPPPIPPQPQTQSQLKAPIPTMDPQNQLTTEHLLAIISISNLFMNLQNFTVLQLKPK
jgi:WD repeat-containing protein 7